MPKLKSQWRVGSVQPTSTPAVVVPTQCCVVCYNDFTPFPFDSEQWNTNMIKSFYIALNIPWSGSGDEDGDDDEEVVSLPFCPQCHSKVSVMQTYMIELQNIQSKFNSVRNDVAFSIVNSIGRHSKDGPIVQIRQQIYEKWKLTHEEKQKEETLGDTIGIGLEYVAHEPSSRPHVCGNHVCNCQRNPEPQAHAEVNTKEGQGVAQYDFEETMASDDDEAEVGNGNAFEYRQTKPILPRGASNAKTMNGSLPMPILKKERTTMGFNSTQQFRIQQARAGLPNLIPFRSPYQRTEMTAFERKLPAPPRLCTSIPNTKAGPTRIPSRPKLNPPTLTYAGAAGSVQRSMSISKLKPGFPGRLMKYRMEEAGRIPASISKTPIRARVPGHVVSKTPILARNQNRMFPRSAGIPVGRPRPLTSKKTQRMNSTRGDSLAQGEEEEAEAITVEPEIERFEAQTPALTKGFRYGKRKYSGGHYSLTHQKPAKTARMGLSKSLGASPRRGRPGPRISRTSSSVRNEASPRTRGSPIKSSPKLTVGIGLEFQCEWCPMSYASFPFLKRHGSSKHPEKQDMRCHVETCRRGFTSDLAFKRHMQNEHQISVSGLATMKCPLCKKCFVKHPSFKSHLKSHNLSQAKIQEIVDTVTPVAPAIVDASGDVEPTDEPTAAGDGDVDPNAGEESQGDGDELIFIPVKAKRRTAAPPRQFNVRRKKRGGRKKKEDADAPEAAAAPPTSPRKRAPKTSAAVSPVRKSSRQRGVHVDPGLPMYPVPKTRGRNKVKNSDGQEEEPTDEAPVGEGEKPVEQESTLKTMKNGESTETEDKKTTADQVDASEADGSTGDNVNISREDKGDTAQEGQESEFDKSFVRGAKSDKTLSSSPIRLDMKTDTIFSSTPMPQPKPVVAAPIAPGTPTVDCSMINNATVDEKRGDESTMDLSLEESQEDFADVEDNADKSQAVMNTTYTLGDTMNAEGSVTEGEEVKEN